MLSLLPSLFEQLESCAPAAVCTNKGVRVGETAKSYIVELSMPGIEKDKIEITYEKGSLLVKAEEGELNAETKYLISSPRQYAYQVGLPTTIDSKIAPEAVYKDGVLVIEFQKAVVEQPLKIAVK